MRESILIGMIPDSDRGLDSRQKHAGMTCEEQDTLSPVRQLDFEQRKTFSSTLQFLLSECLPPTSVICV